MHAGVDEHESVAGAQRPRIDVRHAGEVDRHPQPPDAGQHAFPPAHLARSGRLSHGAGRYRPGDGEEGRRRERIRAPEFEYRDEHGSVLVLRGSMTPATRTQYAEVAGGNILSQEDAWQRAVEYLFERLAVRWDIAGTEPLTRQKDLLARFRFASAEERRWIREVAARAPGRALPGSGGPVNPDAFARLLTDYCLEAQPGPDR